VGWGDEPQHLAGRWCNRLVSARDRSSGAPLGDAQAEVVIFSLERPALFEIGLKAKK